MTRILARRLKELETRIVPPREPPRLWIACNPGWGLALGEDRCLQILGECGFLPTGVRFGAVNLLCVPGGLDAEELEGFLREHGALTRDFQRTQNYCGPRDLG
jgi:hypothetical protein